MAKPVQRAMADLTGTGQNVAINTSDMEVINVFVGGTFVATYTVEVSGDGTNFVPAASGAGQTVAAITSVPNGVKQVRINCTAFTSGTLESVIGGKDDDRLG